MLCKEKDGSGFEQVPNALIRTASIKAIGMWCFIAQLPDGWNFSVSGLTAVMKEGKDAIRAAIKELEELGFLVRKQVKDSNGKFRYGDWELRYHAVLPSTDSPSAENPSTVFPTQYKDLNIKDLKKQIPKDSIEKKKNEPNIEALAESIIKKWNDEFSDKAVPKVSKLTTRRKDGIKQRLRDGFSESDLIQAIEIAARSSWCTSGKWSFGFDWLFCCKNNIIKVLEGNYNNRGDDDLINAIVEASYFDVGDSRSRDKNKLVGSGGRGV